MAHADPDRYGNERGGSVKEQELEVADSPAHAGRKIDRRPEPRHEPREEECPYAVFPELPLDPGKPARRENFPERSVFLQLVAVRLAGFGSV